jgi:hypothetical protein
VAPSATLYFVTVLKSLPKKPSRQTALIRSAEADCERELVESAEQPLRFVGAWRSEAELFDLAAAYVLCARNLAVSADSLSISTA